MKSAGSITISGHIVFAALCLLAILEIVHANQFNDDDTARSLYLSHGSPMAKGGWRPILSSDTIATYNFANVLGGQTLGQKILTGPALIETKVISPHIVNVSPFTSDFLTNGILSTSTRPLVTRDANKLTSIAQTYKTSIFPQSNLNLNAPINSYLNPFAIPSGPGTYKLNPGFQFDSGLFLKHQQPILSHRPTYNKIQNQMLLGKRLKHNQFQGHVLQQLSSNNYHQPIQSYQTTVKKPLDSYQRPIDVYKRPGENYKPNNLNYQSHVNPQESLLAQTKNKQSGHGVAAVTYKPPFNSHFQQFGIKEEPFGPIPSSILGSFSSFGHASIKAREPSFNIKNVSPATTTNAPFVSTEAFTAVSTASSKVKVSSQESIYNTSNKQNTNIRDSNDFTRNLVPPPQVTHYSNTQFKTEINPTANGNSGNFIPSPPDPLSKHQNAPEIIKTHNSKIKQSEQFSSNKIFPTKRPEITSFFETSSPVSTVDPFDSQSTNAIPDNLLVQVPPPYTTIHSFSPPPQSGPPKANKPAKYNIFEDPKYFPPTAGHEFFGNKFTKNNFNSNAKDPNKGSYEVTETWGSSGETNTQPTLHTWISPAQSYKHYNTGIKSPPLTFNIGPKHEDRLIPFTHSPSPPKSSKSPFADVSTVYSTIQTNNDHKTFYTQLENSLSALDELNANKNPIGDEAYDLAAPVNVTFGDEIVKPTSIPIYEDVTTQQFQNSKRKPSRYKPFYESSTVVNDDDVLDFTTRFETFKEPNHETENDLQVNELPTLPPNRHFKRPITTTPSSLDDWDENKARKKLKNRRRRPTKSSTTTTETPEPIAHTDYSIRNNRYRTTTIPTDVEGVTTKILRPKIRLPVHRTRLTTKPTSQSELTSSAQPTMIPTAPVTTRPRLHSRIRLTTMSSLIDFDDSFESTTRVFRHSENSFKQSSIMKIAKDNHSNRFSSVKVNPNKYDKFRETPDYSHKQDEKDTPTSDVSVNTSEHKYSAQIQKNEMNDKVVEPNHDEDINAIPEIEIEHTSPSSFDDFPITNIEASQITKSEQLFTEQKLGNRGSAKLESSRVKNEPLESQESINFSEETEAASTTPISVTKLPRQKNKPGKYDNNRPRFSVKDYRNRLNQYTSTSTDKPNVSSEPSSANTRLRFPNRSRFPSFKDPYDTKVSPSDVSTSTEAPRKKFTPKDPRHRGSVESDDNDDEETLDVEIKPSSSNQKSTINEVQENEVVVKPLPKLRNSLRRDPNRSRTSTTESSIEYSTEKNAQKSINTYTNLKRPGLTIRKRIHIKNVTVEASEAPNLEAIATTTESAKEADAKNETSTEKYTSETAIMKIAKDDRKSLNGEEPGENSSLDQSKRVSDLTLASSKEYSSGLFKSVSPNTRRVPNYFTIATDDPILPIEAFFPQLNQKREA